MTTELKVFDSKGKELGTAKADASVFGRRVRTSLLHETVRWQRAKKRAGTHSTKTRAEVTGGGIKPWKQKGTGRARAGSNTSPLWVGGGIAHGPKPRSYEFSLNRKQRRLALCGALSELAKEGKCLVVKEFAFSEIKTKQAAALLESLGLELGKRVTVVVENGDEQAIRSFRNLKKVRVLEAAGLNVYDVLNSEHVVFAQPALDAVVQRLGSSPVEAQ